MSAVSPPASYEEERDNFFCLTCLLFNIGSKTLRSYFKNTWPKVNGTGAAWSDVPADGVLLLRLASKGLKLANHEKAAVQAGDTNEWDLTIVIKVLMHSKFAHGPGFVIPHSQEYYWLDDIREIRNQLIGHAKETLLPNTEFLAAWQLASGILENFGAAKEEITAVRNDIEGTRKDAQEYRQRLLEAEEREKKMVEHLKTVDERLVNIEKNQSEIYDEIQKRQEEKVHKDANDATNRDLRNVIHINVTAEAGSHIAISDIASALGQGKTDTSTAASAAHPSMPQTVIVGNARAIQDYEAENDSHLSLSCGDIVTVLGIQGNCWLASKDGHEGLVPYDHLKLTSFHGRDASKPFAVPKEEEEDDMYSTIVEKNNDSIDDEDQCLSIDDIKAESVGRINETPDGTTQCNQTGTAQVKGIKAKVMFDYEAKEEDELSLEVGDVVDVLDEICDDGWWMCEIGDKRGLFPFNFLETLEGAKMAQAKDKPQTKQVKGIKAKVKFDYEAEEEDELSLEVGDVVDVLDEICDDGWWMCEIGDKRGIFPSNFLETLEGAKMAQAKDKPQTKQGKPLCDSGDDDVYEEELDEGPDISNYEDDDSDDDYESGTEYGSMHQWSHDTYCATRSARSKKKDLTYEELLPSYKKTSMSGEWKAVPLNEVITSKVEGISEEEWSADKLFSDPDDYLQRMASSGGDTKSKVEQKFLQEILPSLESKCRQTDHHSDEIYQILAKLSCCQHSQSTVKHSLYLLRHLLTKDKVELTNARTIVKIEKILRGSFSSKDGLFNLESFAAQRLRLTVYSKVLCLLAICRCKGFVTFQSIDLEERESAKVLLEILKKCFSDKSYKKKDRLRHVAELTLTSLKWIFTEKQPIEQLSKALQCFKELLSKFDSLSEQDVIHLVKKLCGYEWVCLQVTLCCIEHEIRSDPNALNLLFSIVERETSKKTLDWKLFTAVSGILSNATMTNRDKDIRVRAGWKLVEYLQATKVKKTPEVMEAIQRKLSRVLFSPDPPVRTSLARVLSADSDGSISTEHIMNYLCWFYRNQALERKKIIKETKNELVCLGSFQGQTVAIKTMRPGMLDLRKHESDEIQKIKSGLTKESYFLRRLNEVARHPNIIHLLCCNTVRIPYHLITEYMTRGNLLKYLRHDCRSETPLRELANLSQWCLEILEALVFLSKYKIVHKKIMARSVFVAEDEVCKLSGFSAAEQIMEAKSDVIMYSSGKAQLDSPGVVRWLAPEVLREGCYSKASDVWAFGVLMHEVFSLGCDPFRPALSGRPIDDDLQVAELILAGNHLPKLPCFDKKVYKLMERCWMVSPSDRIPVEQLRGDLFKLQLEFMKTDAQFPASPPPVFPDIRPSSEEDALKRVKELRKFLNSQQKKASNARNVKEYMYYDASARNAVKVPHLKEFGRNRPHLPPPRPSEDEYLPSLPPSASEQLQNQITKFLRSHASTRKYIKRIKEACLVATATVSYWNKDSERPTFMFPKGSEIAVYCQSDPHWWEGQCLRTGAFGQLPRSHVTIHEDAEKVFIMEEILTKNDYSHLENVKKLLDGNENIVKILLLEPFGKDRIRMVSQLGVKRNLLDHLVQNGSSDTCITYLCQVASAVHFLHKNHIIHCDLQVNNVFVLSNEKVQLGQLGRSRQLTVPDGEASSASCKIVQKMPKKELQWCPPEVIQNGSYSHASDVWSFGILGWEICSVLKEETDYDFGEYEKPFSFVDSLDKKRRRSSFITYLKSGKRMSQPEGCPDWLFLLLAVCWKYIPQDRPSMNTIQDHLINRKPIIPVSLEKDHTALLNAIWDDIDTPFTRPRCGNLVTVKDRPKRAPQKKPDALLESSDIKPTPPEGLYKALPCHSEVRLPIPPAIEECYDDFSSILSSLPPLPVCLPSRTSHLKDNNPPSKKGLSIPSLSSSTEDVMEELYDDSSSCLIYSSTEGQESGEKVDEDLYAPLEESEESSYMDLCKDTILLPSDSVENPSEVNTDTEHLPSDSGKIACCLETSAAGPSVDPLDSQSLSDIKDASTDAPKSDDAIGACSESIHDNITHELERPVDSSVPSGGAPSEPDGENRKPSKTTDIW